MSDTRSHSEKRLGVLVGHDGSGHADGALAWALDHARRTEMPVTVSRSWVLTTAPRPASWSPGYMPPLDDFAEAVRAELLADIAPYVEKFPEVDVRTEVPHGSPGRHLVELSAHADLLVVSSRGRGGFREMLLGSVSDQVARHAKCPVVITRARSGPTDPTVVLDGAFEEDPPPD